MAGICLYVDASKQDTSSNELKYNMKVFLQTGVQKSINPLTNDLIPKGKPPDEKALTA